MCITVSEVMSHQVSFRTAGPVRCLPLNDTRRAFVSAACAAKKTRLRERERRITELCQKACEDGGIADRAYWSMVYDFEMAVTTNSRTLLVEIGVLPIPPQDLTTPQELHEALWTVIEALASRGVFLLNTDHLTDSQLYERLFYKILDEPTQCLPPNSAASEYIDVLHPWDVDAGGQGEALSERIVRGEHPMEPRVKGKRAPQFTQPPVDRDRYLPLPDSDEAYKKAKAKREKGGGSGG